jgi:YjbE family integral membrane protein
VAIALRLVLTLAVSSDLMVPGLRFAGAVLLVGIACKLVQEENPMAEDSVPAPTSLGTALVRIAVADLVMSLDHVMAIAALSRSDPVVLAVGLILSIALILVCSSVILAVMDRFRWVVYAGTALLAWAAVGMMRHDLEFVNRLAASGSLQGEIPMWADWALRLLVVVACLTSGRWWPRRSPAIESI